MSPLRAHLLRHIASPASLNGTACGLPLSDLAPDLQDVTCVGCYEAFLVAKLTEWLGALSIRSLELMTTRAEASMMSIRLDDGSAVTAVYEMSRLPSGTTFRVVSTGKSPKVCTIVYDAPSSVDPMVITLDPEHPNDCAHPTPDLFGIPDGPSLEWCSQCGSTRVCEGGVPQGTWDTPFRHGNIPRRSLGPGDVEWVLERLQAVVNLVKRHEDQVPASLVRDVLDIFRATVVDPSPRRHRTPSFHRSRAWPPEIPINSDPTPDEAIAELYLREYRKAVTLGREHAHLRALRAVRDRRRARGTARSREGGAP